MKNMAKTKYITCRASQITLCSFNVTAKEGMSLHIPLNVIGAYVLILYLSGILSALYLALGTSMVIFGVASHALPVVC